MTMIHLKRLFDIIFFFLAAIIRLMDFFNLQKIKKTNHFHFYNFPMIIPHHKSLEIVIDINAIITNYLSLLLCPSFYGYAINYFYHLTC